MNFDRCPLSMAEFQLIMDYEWISGVSIAMSWDVRTSGLDQDGWASETQSLRQPECSLHHFPTSLLLPFPVISCLTYFYPICAFSKCSYSICTMEWEYWWLLIHRIFPKFLDLVLQTSVSILSSMSQPKPIISFLTIPIPTPCHCS